MAYNNLYIRDGPWPYPTLFLTRNKIRGWPALDRVPFDPTRRDFFWSSEGKKIEKFDVFRGNFPNTNHRWLTRPDLARATKNWPYPTRSHHYVYIQTFVCIILMSICFLEGHWNPNPCTDLDKILHTHPPSVQERFWCSFDLNLIAPLDLGPWALKAEGHSFENCLQNKRCSAGCKLIRTAPGTSASSPNKNVA